MSRDRLVQRILSTIHNNSILLCGGSRSSRTALLLELRSLLLKIEDPVYRFFPVYVDLQEVPEHRFFGALAAGIREQLGSVESRGRAVGSATPPIRYSHRDLARDLRTAVQLLAEQTPRHVKLVLLVNGIEALECYHPRTSQRLRGLFMTSFADNLVMVASAVAISRRWDREGSPWYNFFEEICPTDGR